MTNKRLSSDFLSVCRHLLIMGYPAKFGNSCRSISIYFLFIVWHLRLVISSAKACSPCSRIYWIQAGRSDLNRKAKIFPIKLEYILHSFTSLEHSAQVWKPWPLTHDLILHQVAFSFSWQPGHLSARYFRHAPQYSPHAAISSLLATIFFIYMISDASQADGADY